MAMATTLLAWHLCKGDHTRWDILPRFFVRSVLMKKVERI